MQGLYERYVRSGYYARRHPFRSAFVYGLAMFAVLWPVLWRMDQPPQVSTINPLLYALQYSCGFAFVRALFSRSRRQRAWFERWAAKHPEPVSAEPARHAAAQRPALPRGRDLLSWLGWTLLVAVPVCWFLGRLLTTAFGSGRGGDPVITAIAVVISIPSAIYLRLYWPPARDWKCAPDRRSQATSIRGTVATFV